MKAAAEALANGDMVGLMPEGTIPRGRAFFEPELKGRWGAARLAAMSGAPVIPIGSGGPRRSGRARRGCRPCSTWSPADDPRPCRRRRSRSTYSDPDADTKRIMHAIMDLLPPESRVRREPTPEEIARALPPGYKADPDDRSSRSSAAPAGP